MMINTAFLFDDIFTLSKRAVTGTVDPVLKTHTHKRTMTHTSFKWKERKEGKRRGDVARRCASDSGAEISDRPVTSCLIAISLKEGQAHTPKVPLNHIL